MTPPPDVGHAECPLESAEAEAPVQHRELNRVLRLTSRFHLEPMKQEQRETRTILDAHVLSCALRDAKLMGALRVLAYLSTGTFLTIAGKALGLL